MRKVLCLDDDVVIAKMVADVVRFCAFEQGSALEPVIETDSMRAIIEHARNPDFVVAVVDLLMPRVTGVDVLAAFSEHNAKCRRVLLTAAPQEAIVRTAVAEGIIHRVIVKPPGLHELRAVIDWL